MLHVHSTLEVRTSHAADRGRRWPLAVCTAFVLACSPAHAYDWLQYNGDAQHSGNNTLETAIGKGNVAQMTQKFQVTLAGTADGAPVFLEASLDTGRRQGPRVRDDDRRRHPGA